MRNPHDSTSPRVTVPFALSLAKGDARTTTRDLALRQAQGERKPHRICGLKHLARTKLWCLAPILAMALLPLPAGAQTRDYLFPTTGHWTMSLVTGSPYVGLVEASVGVTKSVAMGFVVGVTPNVVGFGIRPRLKLDLNEQTSLRLRAPILYYPRHGDPWALTHPTLVLERQFRSGLRLHAGAGMMFAVGVNHLLGKESEAEEYDDWSEDGEYDDEEGFKNGTWNTFSVGGAVSVGKRTELFFDVSTVMHGLQFAGQNWKDVGGPPVLVSIGLTRHF